jgi:DNA-binding SARP family transcriptional activator
LATGDADAAEHLAGRALEVEPWSEAAYRVLVAVHLERGERVAARRMLDRCHVMLADLGFEPEEATRMLEQRLKAPDLSAR